MRSATAHKIFEDDDRFEVDSAGTDETGNKHIDLEILNWCDSIVVMERRHRNYIRKNFPSVYNSKNIVCLYIRDDYDFMQEELIEIIKRQFENVYSKRLLSKK